MKRNGNMRKEEKKERGQKWRRGMGRGEERVRQKIKESFEDVCECDRARIRACVCDRSCTIVRGEGAPGPSFLSMCAQGLSLPSTPQFNHPTDCL